MSKKFIYKYISKEELKSISAKIGEIEKTTSGELVITIKEKRGWFEKTKSVHKLAEKEFINAKIAKTNGATGILFFVIFNAKEFCILADKSIHDKVEQKVWDDIASNMTSHFKEKNFCKGILSGLGEAGEILSTHFPVLPGDVNELSNEVRVK
jgi:uncharacterized membrane protein